METQEEDRVMQARALWADRRFRGFFPLMLMLSILCMLAGELFCGAADRAWPEGCFALASPQEDVSFSSDAPDPMTAAGASILATGSRTAASGNGSSSLFRNEVTSRAVRSAAFLAGFLFIAKILLPSAGWHLSVYSHPEMLRPARFLRELFIQKKKDGKKLSFPLRAH